jgi:methionine-rich copper-binding protein CopC
MLGACVLIAASALAQDDPADVIVQGKEGYQYLQSGTPTVLEIGNVGTVGYAFDGSPVEVPFTLQGSGATVVLGVYGTTGDTDAGWYGPRIHDFTTGGLEYWGEPYHYVSDGLDTLLYLSTPKYFQEGAGSITWNGQDKAGNALSPGTYRYYLLGVDDQGDPTVVARGVGAWLAGPKVITMADGSELETPFALSISGSNLVKSNLGVDYLSNPTAYETIALPQPGNLTVLNIAHDPQDDVNTYYATAQDTLGAQGIIRLLVSDGTAEMDPDFGDAGWATIDETVGRNVRYGVAIHQGVVYATFMEFWTGPTALAYTFEEDSGDLLSIEDLSHVCYMYNRRGHPNKSGEEYTGPKDEDDPYTNNKYARGPSAIHVDDSGIYLTSWVMRRQVKLDHAFDALWINDPGDGYGDNEYIYNSAPTKYGFFMGPGRATIYQGWILGPDGSGFLHFNPVNVMGHTQLDLFAVLDDTPYDGIYFLGSDGAGQFEDGGPSPLVQLPFDLATGIISSDVAVEEVEAARPHRFALGQATPNPFNPSTAITFSVAEDVHTTLVIYNSLGQIMRTLVDEPLAAGTYRARWNGRDDAGHVASAGVYFYVMEAGTFTETRSMTVMK